MFAEEKILIGCNENTSVSLLPKLANRHGLIAGATGTGKTVTLKVLAESFSDLGVPVFLADMKGDISGLAKVGSGNDFITKNREKYGLDDKGFKFKEYPVEFWDLFGEKGLPVRVTLSEMGPVLLSKILNLSEAQAGILNIVFRVADEKSLPIIDLKDLKSMINHVVENKDAYEGEYGAIAAKSANTILRSLITLEDQGGNGFFGEPALELSDFMQVDDNGCGVINIMDVFLMLKSYPFHLKYTQHSCFGCCPLFLRNCLKLEIWTSLNSYFSLMKHTCFLMICHLNSVRKLNR